MKKPRLFRSTFIKGACIKEENIKSIQFAIGSSWTDISKRNVTKLRDLADWLREVALWLEK